MPNSSILVAKVKEITEAYQVAKTSGKLELAEFYNRELIHYLWRLSVTIADSRGNRSTDSGEQ